MNTKDWVSRALNAEERIRRDEGWIAQLTARAEAAEAALAEMEEALRQIEQWGEAYPLDIFPEPDWKRAHALLEAGGMTLDSVSAGAMRRVIVGCAQIARAALATTKGEPDEA
jgi:hypothetical protein